MEYLKKEGSGKIKHYCPIANRTPKPWQKFALEPGHVIFSDYKVGLQYKKKVLIINQDTILHQINIKSHRPLDTDVKFSVVGDQRIIAGLHVIVEIIFTPLIDFGKTKFDRRFEIDIFSDTANYIGTIPIMILSKFPEVNFPKEIILPESSTGIPTFATICVFNLSSISHTFTIVQENSKKDGDNYPKKGEFHITPDPINFVMEAGRVMIFIFEYIPLMYGDLKEKILVEFDSGKISEISVDCHSIEYNLSIDQHSLVFPETLIGHNLKKMVCLTNNSGFAINYQWSFDSNRMSGSGESFANMFEIVPMYGIIYPKSQIDVSVLLKVPTFFEEIIETPLNFGAVAILKYATSIHSQIELNLEGTVIGPDIIFPMQIIHMSPISQTETRQFKIPCRNKGEITGQVIYRGHDNNKNGLAKVSPVSMILKPNECKEFILEYTSQLLGSYEEHIYFQIVYGSGEIEITLQGVTRSLSVAVSPECLDFGVVSMCSRKSKLFTFTNPYNQPLKLTIEENGIDKPLVFEEFLLRQDIKKQVVPKNRLESIKEIDAMPTPISSNELANEFLNDELQEILQNVDNHIEIDGEIRNNVDVILANVDTHIDDVDFIDDFISTAIEQSKSEREKIGEFGVDVVIESLETFIDQKATVLNIYETMINKLDARQIINTTVDGILEKFSKRVRYYEKDWCLPKNPLDLSCNPKSIIIPPKSTGSIQITLIPNKSGTLNQEMNLSLSMSSNLDEDCKSNDTLTKIPLKVKYECVAPKLVIKKNKKIHLKTYPNLEVNFMVRFFNPTKSLGFYYFETDDDAIVVDRMKFALRGGKEIDLGVRIKSPTVGIVEYRGRICALGDSNAVEEFTAQLEVLPLQIIINPLNLYVDSQQVLEESAYDFVLVNQSPMEITFTAKLESEIHFMSIIPSRKSVPPRKSVILCLRTKFTDPNLTKNTLLIDVETVKIFRIPITIRSTGIPIIFDPPINRCSIEFGDHYISNLPVVEKITMKNIGTAEYTLSITARKKKTKTQKKNYFLFDKQKFTIQPGEEIETKVTVLPTDDVGMFEENFSIDWVKHKMGRLENLFRTPVRINVCEPCLQWSRDNVNFVFFYGEEYNKKSFQELTLTNCSPLPITTVISVTGYYSLINLDEASIFNKIKIYLNPNESRIFYIDFDINQISLYSKFTQFSGTIKIKCNGCRSKIAVNLSTKLYYPIIEVSNKYVEVYSSETSKFLITNLKNVGRMNARFNLKFKIGTFSMESFRQVDESKTITEVSENNEESSDHNEGSMKISITDDAETVKSFEDNYDDNNDESKKSSINEDIDIVKSVEENSITSLKSEDQENSMSVFVKEFVTTMPFESNSTILNTITALVENLEYNDIPNNFITIHPNSCGIDPGGDIPIYMNFNDITHLLSDGIKICLTIELTVIGGNTEEIQFVGYFSQSFVTLELPVFDVGVQPWFKKCTHILNLKSRVPFPVSVRFNEIECNSGDYSSLNFNISEMILNGNEIQNVKITSVLGMNCLSAEKSKLKFDIDGCRETKIFGEISGFGRIPTISILNLKRNVTSQEIEYNTLQQIYNDTEMDDNRSETLSSIESNLTLTSVGGNDVGDNKSSRRQRRTTKQNSFEILDYPDEYPTPFQIASDTEQNIFYQIYNESLAIRTEIEKLADKYSSFESMMKSRPTAKSLPFDVQQYELDLGTIKINQPNEHDFAVQINGPGELNLAIRSEIQLSNFNIEFHDTNNPSLFTVKNYTHDINNRKVRLYRNRIERDNDSSNCSSIVPVRRFHSYDLNSRLIHTRVETGVPTDRKKIREFYTNLLKRKQKSAEKIMDTDINLLHSEIYQENPIDPVGSVINVRIQFQPTEEFYRPGMEFIEVIHIDVHLGLSVPVLLRGWIQNDNTPMLT